MFVYSISEEVGEVEPMSYREAINSNDANNWKKAMEEKMDSLWKNDIVDIL